MDSHGVLLADAVTSTFFMVLLLSTMVAIAGSRIDGVHHEEGLLELRILMDDVACAVDLAVAGGPGREVVVELPPRLNHTSAYRLRVNSTGVYGWADGYRGFSDICPVIIADSRGNPASINLEAGRKYSIRNTCRNNRTLLMVSEVRL
ncbi:hypothetical protein [Methanothermobacter sp.]|uniref:hypothetical protein n=1 Tax=Methanothermobacter sp. TaxID=1884223 RepID=UPI002613D330|nr:hypothetical protein [Methanothermobacter sp.]MDI9614013.1 hypothetical protein [Methanothermobacter sp.]